MGKFEETRCLAFRRMRWQTGRMDGTETEHVHESKRPSQLRLFDRLSDLDTSNLLADIRPSLV